MKQVITGALLCVISSACYAQEMPAPPEPTKQHEELATDAGEWEGEMKAWMVPGADPMIMPITETNTVMPGGLWLSSEFQCGPFSGRGIFGYDTLENEHVGTWVDNGSTHMSVMRGEVNDDGELVMIFTGFDQQTQSIKKLKSVTKRTGEGKKHFTMYQEGGSEGEWIKLFEIDYRKKA